MLSASLTLLWSQDGWQIQRRDTWSNMRIDKHLAMRMLCSDQIHDTRMKAVTELVTNLLYTWKLWTLRTLIVFWATILCFDKDANYYITFVYCILRILPWRQLESLGLPPLMTRQLSNVRRHYICQLRRTTHLLQRCCYWRSSSYTWHWTDLNPSNTLDVEQAGACRHPGNSTGIQWMFCSENCRLSNTRRVLRNSQIEQHITDFRQL